MQEKTQERSAKIINLIALFLAIALLGVIHLLNPSFFPTLWQVLATGDFIATADYIRSFGSWAILCSFLLVVFANAIGFPPAFIFSTANTIIFGIVPGIILSVIAETVGVVISFLLLRYLFRGAAEKVIAKHPKLAKIDKYSGEKGFIIMLIARVVPYLPSGFINAVGALSAISLRDYTIAAFIGKFPSTAIEAIIGHDTVSQENDPTRIILACVVAAILMSGAWYYERRYLNK
ncbi:TVP38/TMEM64 family protein [Selenomonas sp. TAMA-11512]|uniref:TVP38/TMEM64 family protein n=1 Tax=Selenomonas sp. TAMA-11512 TaxID=3095337 RepID=UPI003093595F|nr:TVP38/TMEM64 family protein [Selenomonas sp. TAMA-11512]